jgi:trehalose synthase
VNATPMGGGVAEILRSLVPLMQGCGIAVEWLTLQAGPAFFEVTKKLHNLLQGQAGDLTEDERRLYLDQNEQAARALAEIEADLWVIHDPQPAAVIGYHPDLHPAIWRSHIDTSQTNPQVCDFLMPFVAAYDRLVFTLPEYVFPDLPPDQVAIVSPTIDPLTVKNAPVGRSFARRVLTKLGIARSRPLVTQVSRFDPWKDPLGVIDAYRLAKPKVPGLQLALVGVLEAQDDPEALRVLEVVQRYAGDDPDIHVYGNPQQVGHFEVNCFQTASDVVVQKSIREGFGLVVTEAMWKRAVVVGARVGGIQVQIRDGENGFLVDDVPQCAERIVHVLTNQDLRRSLGRAARESVREHYLLPVLLERELSLYRDLLACYRRRQAA